jgi:hypothetical protein
MAAVVVVVVVVVLVVTTIEAPSQNQVATRRRQRCSSKVEGVACRHRQALPPEVDAECAQTAEAESDKQ